MALVTGAARGIGFETARQMHVRGASVAIVDLDADEAREAAERIGERTIGIAADVTDAGAMRAAVAETVERFGGLDVAMANAGLAPPSIATMRSVPAEEWERVIDVNLLGVWHTVRAGAAADLRAQGPHRRRRLGRRLRQRDAGQLLHGLQGRGRADGRALRTELMPLGASASVAYFGWVDTRMVQDTFARPGASVLEEIAPDFLMKRITPPNRRERPSSRGSKSGRRGSSRRSGGATSPPCAACSTRCSTAAASATRGSRRRSATPSRAGGERHRDRGRRELGSGSACRPTT